MRFSTLKHKGAISKIIAFILALFLLLLSLGDITSIFAIQHPVTTPPTYDSLPGIEGISATTTQTDPYNILEIVPVDGTGSMGYYLEGYEPLLTSYKAQVASLTSPAAREAYFASLISTLSSHGILNAVADTSPMSLTADYVTNGYQEYIEKPWSTVPVPSDAIEINLNTIEYFDYVGNFVEAPANDGDFNVENEYILATPAGTGTHNLSVAEFIYGEQTDGTYHYFDIAGTNLDTLGGTGLYPNPAVDPVNPMSLSDYLRGLNAEDRIANFPETYIYTLNPAGYYEYRGNTKDLAVVIPNAVELFVVNVTTIPSETHSVATPYAAKNPSGYEPATGGAYVVNEIFELVTVGTGTHDFVEDPAGTDSYRYAYKTIHLKLPYTNNNWLLWDVFNDFDTAVDGPFISITSKTPANITAEEIAAADLVVLSAGYDITTNTMPTSGYATAASDLTTAQINAIKEKIVSTADPLTPIVVDGRLNTATAAASNVKNFVAELYNGTTSGGYAFTASPRRLNDAGVAHSNGFVDGNLYFYMPQSSGDNLITTNFNEEIDDELYDPSSSTNFSNAARSPYNEIFVEIGVENFLRGTTGAQLLPDDDISIATAIRYVINYSDQRIINNKDTVEVLQLQPVSRETYNSSIPTDTNGNIVNGAEIKSMFLPDSSINNVNVETMGTPEFIGKIEDINEVYDMLYIGSDISGLNNSGGITTYNDDDMNGLIYTNIGDSVPIRNNYIGMLDSDFIYDAAGKVTNIISGTADARYSGNDITEKKKQEIIDFANTGFPIIISNGLVGAGTGATTPETEDIEIEANANTTVGKVELKADEAYHADYRLAEFSYQWYRQETSGAAVATPVSNATGVTLTTSQPGYYYLEVALTYKGATTKANSNIIQVISGISFNDVGGAQDLNIPAFDATGFTINEDRIDNSSILFETLNEIRTLPNVMSETEASINKNGVLQYLNLSKPEIVFAVEGGVEVKPTQYSGKDSSALTVDLLPDNTLTYKFSISNPTDPTPSSTRYQLNLFIDQNGDGSHTLDEQIYDLKVTAPDGSQIAENALLNNTVYTVSRELPTNFFGPVPWKLEVVKVVGNAGVAVTASQTGISYKYVTGQAATEIKVLQIIGTSGSVFWGDEYNSYPLGDITAFSNIFNNASFKSVYDMEITTLTINNVNDNYTDYYALFNSYNMIMLGFTEMFGVSDTGGGLNIEASTALTKYIDSGKSILFTHDTTSPFNVYERYSNLNVPTSVPLFGFTSNTIIRDAVELDRYGVTNIEFGVTKASPYYSTLKPQTEVDGVTQQAPNYVANGYEGADSRTINALLQAGYSIAYKPGSSRTELVTETGGEITHQITRGMTTHPQSYHPTSQTNYPINFGNSVSVTNITQVNSGQITSFPYNVNTNEFGGLSTSGATIPVASTHQQYFQVNMNSDDIVVWYTLGDNSSNQYSHHYNDVANTYYIYNAGNITYSGAGHGATMSPTGIEAQLFVNTLIAAYRAGTSNAEIEFANESGSVSAVFIPTLFNDGVYENTGEALSNQEILIPFRLIDPNLSKNNLAVAMYYQDADGEYYNDNGIMSLVSAATTPPSATNRYSRIEQTGLTILNSAGVVIPTSVDSVGNIISALDSGVQYNIRLSQRMTDYFMSLNQDALTLYLEVTTTFSGNASRYVDLSESLFLTKLGLLDLN